VGVWTRAVTSARLDRLHQVDGAGGRRIACLFARRPLSHDEDLRYRERKGVTTAYGADDDLAYAMTARMDRPELRAIAEAVYGEPRP
jgi:anti-sigma factor RsiW